MPIHHCPQCGNPSITPIAYRTQRCACGHIWQRSEVSKDTSAMNRQPYMRAEPTSGKIRFELDPELTPQVRAFLDQL